MLVTLGKKSAERGEEKDFMTDRTTTTTLRGRNEENGRGRGRRRIGALFSSSSFTSFTSLPELFCSLFLLAIFIVFGLFLSSSEAGKGGRRGQKNKKNTNEGLTADSVSLSLSLSYRMLCAQRVQSYLSFAFYARRCARVHHRGTSSGLFFFLFFFFFAHAHIRMCSRVYARRCVRARASRNKLLRAYIRTFKRVLYLSLTLSLSLLSRERRRSDDDRREEQRGDFARRRRW